MRRRVKVYCRSDDIKQLWIAVFHHKFFVPKWFESKGTGLIHGWRDGMNDNKERKMSDYMIRATAANDYVRAFAITSKDLVEHAREIHHLSPVATAALGRTLSAALMMGSDLKGDKDVMTIQFLGDGPIGGITVTANSHGNVKGFVENPDVILPPNKYGHFDVGGAVGKGTLRVITDIGLREPYSGEVEIQTGEIAQDLTYYFAVSEQVPSVVALGVLTDRENEYRVRAAGGYIVQLMPGCPDEIISALEKNCSAASSVTEMLANGGSPESMLETVLTGMDMHVTETRPVSFKCDCSRDRVTKALIAMGKKELTSLIDEGRPVTLTCHFCNAGYTFSVDELKTILHAAEKRGIRPQA